MISTNASKTQTYVFNSRVNEFKRNQNQNRSRNPNLQCKNDGLKGHLIEKCYKLIGYPKGFKPKSDFNNQNNQNKLFL